MMRGALRFTRHIAFVTLFLCVTNSAFANEAGYKLAYDFITFAGQLKEAKDRGVQAMQAVEGASVETQLGEMISGHERMIRTLTASAATFREHQKSKFAFDQINRLTAGLTQIIDQLLKINTEGQASVEQMLKAAVNNDAARQQQLLADYQIKTSKDSVTIEESYRMIMFYVPVVLYALYDYKDPQTLEPSVTQEQIDHLRDQIVFYYGETAKNGPVVGEKHIVQVGAVMWQGLSKIPPKK